MKNLKGSRDKTLKFPILNDVDYVSIYRTGRSVLEIDGKDLENKTWREFQLYLGERMPVGKCQFTMKFKNSATLHTGMVRAARVGEVEPEKKEDSKMSEQILKEFSALKDALSKATNTGGVTFDMLLASTKQGYEAQVSYLNQKIADKDEIIREVKREVEQLEDDLNDCEKESAKNSGIGQYLAIGEKILSMKFGKPGKVSLKESDQSDIPDQILQVLGIINWSIMDQENINKIANSIQQYLSVLPKEYFKGQ
jgi:hypothetical protein